MGQKNVVAPRFPSAPVEYSQQFFDTFLTVLRLYLNQIDNPGPMAAATQRNGTKIQAALSFIEPSTSVPGQFSLSLPSQADLANLRVGDVYYDSTAGNVLKVKV